MSRWAEALAALSGGPDSLNTMRHSDGLPSRVSHTVNSVTATATPSEPSMPPASDRALVNQREVDEERSAIVRHIAAHFQSTPLGRCAHCGCDTSPGEPLVAIFCGTDHAEIHARCYPRGSRCRNLRRGQPWVSTGLTNEAAARVSQFQRRVAERRWIIEAKTKGKTMSEEQKPITSRELLAKGWDLTQQSVEFAGLPIPPVVHFRIDGANQMIATRVATLDELGTAIVALDGDIGRRVQGTPAVDVYHPDIEQLRQEKAALVELQKRARRSGCPGSTTVIEALFPDVPMRKKTASEKAEDEQWLAIRKEAGLKIDPETAEVDWNYGQTLDPYGVCDEWELPDEFHCVGREYFARSPGSDVWVHFSDLPDTVREEIWARHGSRIAFPAGLEGVPAAASEEAEVPF